MDHPDQTGHQLGLDEYLAERNQLPGWFDALDAVVFQCVHQAQRQNGIRGDLLEIGVYQGKSAALLGYFLGEGERLVVCDLFESPPPIASEVTVRSRFYTDVSRTAFERTYLRFHRRLPEIIQCSSSQLGARADLRRSFRFIHVDGSHLYDMVRRDIATARSLLLDEGVAVFDDFRTPHTPGVAAAVWEALAAGELRPICITLNKIYACVGEPIPAFRAALCDLVAAHSNLRLEFHPLLGTDLARIYASESTVPWAKRLYWRVAATLRQARRRA